jgi:AcrR family transcriptional regulator
MRRLAREAGLSVTTVYKLVGSRDEILRVVVEDSAQLLDSSALVPPSSGVPLVRAAKAMGSLVRYVTDNAALLAPLIAADFKAGYWEKLARLDEGRHLRALKDSIRGCLQEALAGGELRDVVSLRFLESQIYVGLTLALDNWAFDFLDDNEFREWSLSGFYTTLLAVAASDSRARLEKELRELERRLLKRSGRFIRAPAPRCANCQAELPPGALFCSQCGTAVATAVAAAEPAP